MYLSLKFALLLLQLAFTYSAKNVNRLRFHYGNSNINFQLNIEVFEPKGLRVSIPHMDGLEIFSIHGNIVSSYADSREVRNGGDRTFAHDVTGSINGEWVYENRDIKVELGDVLNFWVFLQYKGAGQRFNDLSHLVKKLSSNWSSTNPDKHLYHVTSSSNIDMNTEWPKAHVQSSNSRPQASTTTVLPIIYPRPISANNYASSPAPLLVAKQCDCNDESIKDVWSQLNATLAKMRTLEQNITPLEEKLNSLTETVVELIKNMDIGTKLLLTGNLPSQTNPVEDVRHLIVEKLKLFDLSTTILQAEYKQNSIAFEVSSSIDKLRILKRSNDILSKLSYQIVDPERPVFDVRMSRK